LFYLLRILLKKWHFSISAKADILEVIRKASHGQASLSFLQLPVYYTKTIEKETYFIPFDRSPRKSTG